MPRSLFRLLAILAAGLMLLGACGDDDGGDAATDTTAADVDTDDDGEDVDDDTDAEDGDDAGETTTTEGSGSGGTGNLPNLAQINDFCGLFAAFDDVDDPFEIDEMAADDENLPAQMAQTFQFIEALFGRATALAPNELEADMRLLASGMSEYNALMAEYDYDFMAMAMAGTEDPEAMERLEILDSEEFAAASTRVEEYVLAECGIDLS